MIIAYTYYQLPLTSFDVCYTIFRETIAVLAQTLYAYCNIVTSVVHNRCNNIAVSQLVEALRYKPEGRGFDFQWCQWDFLLT
jgi:hypothetical protein